MTSADDIFQQAASGIRRLGLEEIPFTESPVNLQDNTLRRVFTGREDELRHVFTKNNGAGKPCRSGRGCA